MTFGRSITNLLDGMAQRCSESKVFDHSWEIVVAPTSG